MSKPRDRREVRSRGFIKIFQNLYKMSHFFTHPTSFRNIPSQNSHFVGADTIRPPAYQQEKDPGPLLRNGAGVRFYSTSSSIWASWDRVSAPVKAVEAA